MAASLALAVDLGGTKVEAALVDSNGRLLDGSRFRAPTGPDRSATELADSVETVRGGGGLREAFQSYPMLLDQGDIPEPLRVAGLGVSLEHRDARLALGTTADGHVVIALTRFDALGRGLGRIPFGLTSPEMAAVMGALGCRQAVLLDGGISGQLLVRDREDVRSWPGIRRVPLGLVARPRR